MVDISPVLDEIEFAEKNLQKWMKPSKLPTPWRITPSNAEIFPQPYGVALIISPWNYPFNLLFVPLVGAIAAGNCCILRTSTFLPEYSQLMLDIVPKYLDPEAFAIYAGGREVTSALLELPFNYCFFTGSPNLGKVVMKAMSKSLTPVTLELGGKSPAIIHSSCNLALAARRLVWGKCINAGQTCVAPDYLFLERTIAEEFLEILKNEFIAQYGENAAESQEFCRIVNVQHAQRINNLITDSVDQGAKLFMQNGVSNIENRFIPPTILTDVTPDMPIMGEEIFGPVLPVMLYDEVNEIIKFVNSNERPLTLYLFSSDKDVEELFKTRTTSGSVCINDCLIQVSSAEIPFGGVGNSGMGNYHGYNSFTTFSHMKSVVHRKTWIEVDKNLRYAPYTDDQLKTLKRFM
eukprot:TRINITY_DN11703_c0_g1_i1.p1 TRINITY_DN11703_c0_g1~~TRINITY_DN11703_c0_g1_i1.p1  ORF type:complete len:470 (-),score=115.13 TRINITY_DN11703_c0_g1_i1:743-1957(-)